MNELNRVGIKSNKVKCKSFPNKNVDLVLDSFSIFFFLFFISSPSFFFVHLFSMYVVYFRYIYAMLLYVDVPFFHICGCCCRHLFNNPFMIPILFFIDFLFHICGIRNGSLDRSSISSSIVVVIIVIIRH